jgi:mRNA interferase MazF
LTRGDVVVLVLPRAYGKPRPGVIVQSDLYQGHASLTVLPISTTEVEDNLVRVLVAPRADNGLVEPSFVMVDKIQTVPVGKVGQRIGRLPDDLMQEIDRALTLFLGIGDR